MPNGFDADDMQISHYVCNKAQVYSADLTILTVALEHRTIGMHVQHCGRDHLSSLVMSTKSIYNHTSRPRASTITTSHQYPPNIINSDILYYLYVCPVRNRLGARHDTTRDVRICSIDPCVRAMKDRKGCIDMAIDRSNDENKKQRGRLLRPSAYIK